MRRQLAAGGVKLKKVNKPTEPTPNKNGEYKEGAWETYYSKLAQYEDYLSAKNDAGLEGMEGIAADYNEGRTRIIICNKKAEVGINLHIGDNRYPPSDTTTDSCQYRPT